MSIYLDATQLMKEQLGRDVIIALATCTEQCVHVRNVDGYYKEGCVYIVTHENSQKMKDIKLNSNVAICKDLMNACGLAKNLGNPLREENRDLRDELKDVFCAFYDRHVNELDPGTCILKIKLKWAVAFNKHTKFVIDFNTETAEAIPFENDII